MTRPQWRTEAVLRERIAELEPDEHGVTAGLGTGETLRARHLVAADGGRSPVRKALGIGFTGETRDGG
ncbi:FAD-dependent monooxygenase [Nonomuraea jabiensis]|uniref:2-polyprenyl-6-methoxyphenol hydroxylase-like FAD-dependent oxidoreductase n=1 Tax=Nonomuraea jabiensis TaxID=882448 RepID=A0A7W9LG04_9ACTN|nr:FAD-dependent monooxygenase [Nonomuraea jabiensis]MBB5782429.1 2-polyprenyl-6-methoxyphenol hydroxylase-like FAD-dependent oxidoreductase [Nonomuraea jabiensis]